MTRILVVDDEIILRDEVIEWLTLEGYETAGAQDGIEAVNEAFRHHPDLIICDITMPRLDGHGVLLELRAHPSTADIPFIFVTARAAYEDVRKGMDLGADDYITKPFTRDELLQAIQTRLEKKAAQGQHLQDEVDQWQQAFEQEHEQRQLKSKLVAMFSHDFRNPLASIMSSNSLLRDYSSRMDEDRRLGHFNRIEGSVRQLTQMLDDMLIIAQMESGHLEFKPKPLNIGELVQRIVEEFQIVHGETYQLMYQCRFDDLVMVDSRLLHQIAANLISNAIKYSPQGSQVRVLLEQDHGQIILTVQDDGIGIPEADLSRLFTAFQRASNVGEVRGHGLGLAIVKEAVDLHGGQVSVTSAGVGQGSTFTVSLPVA